MKTCVIIRLFTIKGRLVSVSYTHLHPCGPGIDGEYQRVSQLDTLPLDDFFVEIFKYRLVVGYSFADLLVGGMHVQSRAQRLVHHVNHVESPGVLVQIHVQFLVTHRFLAAVLVQQFIAVFQCGASQQEASLLLVVIDIGFNGPHVKTPLCVRGQGCQ